MREILYYDGEESKLFVEKPGILRYPKLVYGHSEMVYHNQALPRYSQSKSDNFVTKIDSR